MQLFKNDKIEKVFESSLFILAGILFIVFSFFDVSLFSYTLSGLTIIMSIFYLFAYFWTFKQNIQSYLTRGLFFVLLTIVIIFFNNIFLQIFTLIASIFIFYQAIEHFSFTLDMKTINEHYWILDLIYSIILFLAATALIIMDGVSGFDFSILLIISGGIFILDGLTKIILLTKVHPTYNKRSEK